MVELYEMARLFLLLNFLQIYVIFILLCIGKSDNLFKALMGTHHLPRQLQSYSLVQVLFLDNNSDCRQEMIYRLLIQRGAALYLFSSLNEGEVIKFLN
jgi:hypothetical protein